MSARRFEHLAGFLASYFHQDFAHDLGSVDAVAKHLHRRASSSYRTAVVEELDALLASGQRDEDLEAWLDRVGVDIDPSATSAGSASAWLQSIRRAITEDGGPAPGYGSLTGAREGAEHPPWVGRERELRALHEGIVSQKTAAVVGQRGTGKTTLVRRYALETSRRYPGGAHFFVADAVLGAAEFLPAVPHDERTLVVIDEFRADAAHLVRRVQAERPGADLILVARDRLPEFAAPQVRIISLRGLSLSEVRTAYEGLHEPREIERLHGATRGHPSFLTLALRDLGRGRSLAQILRRLEPTWHARIVATERSWEAVTRRHSEHWPALFSDPKADAGVDAVTLLGDTWAVLTAKWAPAETRHALLVDIDRERGVIALLTDIVARTHIEAGEVSLSVTALPFGQSTQALHTAVDARSYWDLADTVEAVLSEEP